jgi:riboflavin transporter FmnP
LKTKTIAAIAVFTAISVVLVLSPAKFPAPYAPFLKYQIWEIPLVVAFLLFGPAVGLSTTIINTLVLLVVYPGSLPIGPLYNLAAVLSMLLGVYIIQRIASNFTGDPKVRITLSTALGCVLRVGVMSVMNWAFLRYPYPIGYNMPVEAIIAMLPIIGLFNATVVLYTIPLSYLISRAARANSGLFIGESTARTQSG